MLQVKTLKFRYTQELGTLKGIWRYLRSPFHSKLMNKSLKILTNITIVSQKLIASIPRCDFHEFTHVTRDAALEEGNIVEIDIVPLNFNIIWLMNDGTNMNIPADYCSSMIRRLTSIDLIMNVRSIELRGE